MRPIISLLLAFAFSCGIAKAERRKGFAAVSSSTRSITGFTVGLHLEQGSFSATSPGYRNDHYKMRNIGALSFLSLSTDQYVIFDLSVITSSLIYEAVKTKNFGGYALESDRTMFNTTHMRLLFAGKVASLGKRTGLQAGFDFHWHRFGLQTGSYLPTVFGKNSGGVGNEFFNNGVAEGKAKVSLGLNLHAVTDIHIGLLRFSLLPSYIIRKGFNLNPEVSFCASNWFLSPFCTVGYRYTRLFSKDGEPYRQPAVVFNSVYLTTGINIRM